MRVISTFLPAEPEQVVEGRPAIVMALDTLVDHKALVVGITVGSMQGPDLHHVRCSDLGMAIVARCRRHQLANYPDGAVILAGVAQVGNAVQRVRKVLAQAPEHAFVLLLCADNKVYDAAFEALGVDLQSAHQRRQ